MLRAAADVLAGDPDAIVCGPGLGRGDAARALLADASPRRAAGARRRRAEPRRRRRGPGARAGRAHRADAADAASGRSRAPARRRHRGRAARSPRRRAARWRGASMPRRPRRARAACSRIPTAAGTSTPAATRRSPTAGTGDVLAGFVGALLAQGLDAQTALRYAVCLHGAAADALRRAAGPLGLAASELIRRRGRCSTPRRQAPPAFAGAAGMRASECGRAQRRGLRRRPGRSRARQQRRARSPARLERAMRRGGVRQREGLADGSLTILPAAHQSEHLVGHREQRLARRRVAEQRRARHVQRALLRQQAQVERRRPGPTRCRTAPTARAATGSRATPGTCPCRRVVDHRHALAAGDLLDALDEVLARVDDRVRAAVGACASSAFSSLPTVPIIVTPSALRPLAGDQADAAGRGVEQDRVAGFEPLTSGGTGTARSGPSASSPPRRARRCRRAACTSRSAGITRASLYAPSGAAAVGDAVARLQVGRRRRRRPRPRRPPRGRCPHGSGSL